MRLVSNFLLALMVFTGCKTPISAQKSKSAANINCSHSSQGQKVTWTKITNIKKLALPAKIGQKKLPLKYSVYTVNDKEVKAVTKAAKSNNAQSSELVLPAPNGTCVVFSLINANTMAPELAAKFPELASLKGTSITDKNVTARVDYDGTTLSAEVKQMSSIYFLAPWKKGKKTYYLVYRKEDAGIPKSTLESK